MRLIRLRASDPAFQEVEFRAGFNIVLAERTKESTKKDSRNGLGKSTFIELIHFCLGKGPQPNEIPLVDDLAGWSFSLDLELFGAAVTLTRYVDSPRVLEVHGSFGAWPIQPTKDDDDSPYLISFNDLRSVLGHEFFGLSVAEETTKYAPTYRSLLAYFSRRGRDAYTSPFEHHRRQAEWDKQVNVAYLLGLQWQDAAAFQELKDEKKILDQLRRAAESGVLPDYLGSEGALDAERARLSEQLEEQERHIAAFRVHEDYRRIESETNQLTEALHRLANANFSDRRAIGLYTETTDEEAAAEVSVTQIEEIYREANLYFPEAVSRQLAEVEAFHQQVVSNRQDYLRSEIARLEHAIAERDVELKQLDQRRAQALAVLETHGALDEFVELQRQVSETAAALNDVEARIERLRQFTEAKAQHANKLSELERGARLRNEELREQRDKAILLFNRNTEALYEEPGRLIIDVTRNGFRFDVDISRARSAGVSNMKVFCFDLTLMQLWANRPAHSPGFLIHDSLLYDGVDERQKALALDRAAREAERLDWQYICTFNSDELPTDLIPEDSPARAKPVVELTDATEDGMLLGRRFS